VTDPQDEQPQNEARTEVIPALARGEGIASTRELPVVDDAAAGQPTVVTPPAEPAVAPPVAAPPTVPGRAAATSRRPLVVAAVVAALVLAVVAGAIALRGRIGDSAAARSRSTGSAASSPLTATITSIDPSGGSGFRRDGSSWRTQTYVSADFGNLKDGVGLLLDLGSPKAVSRVTFDVAGGPIAVQLRAGDAASTSGYATVATDGSASGATTLTPKGGGQHRYWLVWVTKLAPADGGYRAVIQSPTALGSS
jgi:hypothetical protein